MKVALLGYGTVGSGVVEVIESNKESISKRAGKTIELKYVLDLRDFPGQPINEIIVHDFTTILEDDEVEIIAEAMGGINPAFDFARLALEKGKSYVTSNKELVAAHGAELLEIAKRNNVNFLFEASVGGGIPILRALKQSITADEIYEITGILNGTTNYILTKMKSEGRDFNDVLKEAQKLGYAEKNPEADIKGYDACRKIAILSSLAFGANVSYEDIPTEGITKISKEDIIYAEHMKCVIKLLGTCQKQGEEIFARVSPMMIAEDHPLSVVNDVFNAIFVKGNMVGDLMFYGRGAGKLPTASAVVADIVDAAKHKGTNIMTLWDREKIELKAKETVSVTYFVRLKKEEGLEEKIREVFGKVQNVKSLEGEYAFIAPVMTEEQMTEKLDQLEAVQIINKIRIQK